MEHSNKAGTPAWSNITQVGLVVKDVDQAVARLSSLGVGPFEVRDNHLGEQVTYRGKPSDADVRLGIARIGDVGLELIQHVRGETIYKDFLESKGEGFQHIMVAVDDFAKEFEKLTSQGATVLLHYKGRYRELAYLDLHIGGLVVEMSNRPREQSR